MAMAVAVSSLVMRCREPATERSTDEEPHSTTKPAIKLSSMTCLICSRAGGGTAVG